MKKRNEQRYQYWSKHYQVWQASGLSQSAYCRQQNLKLASFNAWVHKIRKTETSLVKLATIPSNPESGTITINVGGQIKITIKAGFDKQLLREVIKALGDGQC